MWTIPTQPWNKRPLKRSLLPAEQIASRLEISTLSSSNCSVLCGMCSVSHECAFFITWTETRKAELETNLTTNLQRRKQELEAIISSVDSDTLHGEDELKRQELNNAKSLAEVTTLELKSELWVSTNTILIFKYKGNFFWLVNLLRSFWQDRYTKGGTKGEKFLKDRTKGMPPF